MKLLYQKKKKNTRALQLEKVCGIFKVARIGVCMVYLNLLMVGGLQFLLRVTYVPKLKSLRGLPRSKEITQTFSNIHSLKTLPDVDEDQKEGCQS